jgi:hypothetical protein
MFLSSFGVDAGKDERSENRAGAETITPAPFSSLRRRE